MLKVTFEWEMLDDCLKDFTLFTIVDIMLAAAFGDLVFDSVAGDDFVEGGVFAFATA